MAFRVMGVGRVEFVERPGAGRDLVRAHILAPFEGARVFALAPHGKQRLAVAEEDDVMVAARAGIAAPFGAGIADEIAVDADRPHIGDGCAPAGGGDLEIIGRVAEHVEAGDVAAIGEIVDGVVCADRIVRMDMQIAVENAIDRGGGINGDEGLVRRDGALTGHAGANCEFARRLGRDVVDAQDRPALGGKFGFPGIDESDAKRRGEFDPCAMVPARIAPDVFEADAHRQRGAGTHEARRRHDEMMRIIGDDLQHDVAWNGGEARRADGIDIEAEFEILFDEGLRPRSGPAEAAVAQPDDDMIAGIEIAIDDVDDDGFLERPLVALLIEAAEQALYRRRLLPRQQRAGAIFRRDVIFAGGIRGLEQRPVGIEFEGRLDPGAVGEAGGADLVIKHQLKPVAGCDLADFAARRAKKRHRLCRFVIAFRRDIGAWRGTARGIICHISKSTSSPFSSSFARMSEASRHVRGSARRCGRSGVTKVPCTRAGEPASTMMRSAR